MRLGPNARMRLAPNARMRLRPNALYPSRTHREDVSSTESPTTRLAWPGAVRAEATGAKTRRRCPTVARFLNTEAGATSCSGFKTCYQAHDKSCVPLGLGKFAAAD